MVELPQRTVGIISCSGEEFAEGTIARIATRMVLEELRPGKTVTLCLPLFLAGGKEERVFARYYPTIAVDGCGKLCAAKATETYSAKPAAVVVVDEIARRHPDLKPESRRHLGTGGMELARRVAEEVAAQVDQILAPTAAEVIDLQDPFGGQPSPTVRVVQVAGEAVGVAGLDGVLQRVRASGITSEKELRDCLLRTAQEQNYVRHGQEEAYTEVLWHEYLSSLAQEGTGLG